MSAVTLPPTASLGQLLDPTIGVSTTTALRFWRRVASRLSVLASRFAAWHALEPRADAVVSYAALCLGCVAALAAFVSL